MQRLFSVLIVGLLTIVVLTFNLTARAFAQSQASMPQAASPAASELKGAFPTALVKGIDSKRLKEGDTVVCQTVAPLHAGNGMLIPSGSKVTGHVTQAMARSKGSADSTLTIVFDKVEVAKGKELPMKGTLQAVGPSLGDTGPDMGAGGSNVIGGNDKGGGSSPGTTPPPMAAMPQTGNTARPVLLPTSQGVLGLKNLQLDANGVLSSPNKEVKLDSGTQMLIKAVISVPAQ
jgi:hypothetical protein